MTYVIRWMEYSDMAVCEKIDLGNTENSVLAWKEQDFKNELREKDTIGQVMEVHGQIVGFMVYLLQVKQIILMHMSVAKRMQRKGLGTAMVDKLKRKLRPGRRERIIVPVRESLLGAHLFMKANGFIAISVLKNDFIDTNEDAYIFKFDLPQVGSEEEVMETEKTIDI
jgi:GNAT superfamily N-acetyltransferase